jgi:hypothetical protein
MLGSDYHAWIPDIGYQRVFNILPHLTDFEAETIAATMERKYPSQWAKLLEAYDNVENLRQSIALFKYCPVLDRDGNLVPLNALPGGVPWGACIGLEYPFFVLRMLRRSWVLLTSTCRASAASLAVFKEVTLDCLNNVQNIPTMVELACTSKIEKHPKARKKDSTGSS